MPEGPLSYFLFSFWVFFSSVLFFVFFETPCLRSQKSVLSKAAEAELGWTFGPPAGTAKWVSDFLFLERYLDGSFPEPRLTLS